MENNRLSQQHTPGDTGSIRRLEGPDWKHLSELNEELRTISPVFQKLNTSTSPSPSAHEWKCFARNLDQRLEETKAPLFRTLRDRISASDSFLARWFWIIVALIALAVAGAVVIVSLPDSPLQLTQTESSRKSVVTLTRNATDVEPVLITDKSSLS